MKKNFLLTAFVFLLGAGISTAKDIPQSLVPSVIVNKFQQQFPNAQDIEWEIKGEYYEVEFEIGWPDLDHKILYDLKGNIILHKQEIPYSQLPAKIVSKLETEYAGYRVKSIQKIESRGKAIYKLTVKTYKEKWKLELDAQGNILQKK